MEGQKEGASPCGQPGLNSNNAPASIIVCLQDRGVDTYASLLPSSGGRLSGGVNSPSLLAKGTALRVGSTQDVQEALGQEED